MVPIADGLEPLLPAVSNWFRATYGAPTPPQRQGWPAIARGENTLIFAPTGSGKTLAAFLACLDHLWRHPAERTGVRVLYISPLKALNEDIRRNLEGPLDGILETSRREDAGLVPLRVAVRTGDTPSSERQKMVRKPPDILITTPESLHLILTSRARETLRSVSHVIVDEIHALCPNKRGVFLALLLERLETLTAKPPVRVGLSATQRPLEEVARYLGGLVRSGKKWAPRPVTIVDTGQRKDLDLLTVIPTASFGPQSEKSIWPGVERRLLDWIRESRSTIVFANNRRVVERLTARLNEQAAELEEGKTSEDGPPRELARAHHGSLSQKDRRTTEEALKRGELAAVIATASLEMGIDMGAVDLVCQVESPGGVSRALQRVGRAGHVVGRSSTGRLIAKTSADLLEAAALTRSMLAGAVEALRVPRNCLDILAQQVVACVASGSQDVPTLFDLVRGAYPYRDLTADAFERVLEMISGRFPAASLRDLRPRISWDRVHKRLYPLPGTAQLALVGGGAIPDTGQYPVYLGEGGPRLGELDEEFVLERRVGETFVLGTATWRIAAIEPQRVLVERAEGQSALLPFWRGEANARTPELGEAVGRLTRELADRIAASEDEARTWLEEDCKLERNAARALVDYMKRQTRNGAAPDDRTVLVETFVDPAGELGLAVLTPFGGKFHQALKLALQGRLRQRLGITLACLHANDGLLFRLPKMDDPPLDVFAGLTADAADALVREELADSALFGLRFRQAAGRALLMPRPDPGRRTPLWLQRLRAKDLLQVARGFPDFPVVVETYRECLDDDLDLPRLRQFLDRVQDGSIRVVTRSGEIASPFTSSLIFRFQMKFLYEWDEPVAAKAKTSPTVDREVLDPLRIAAETSGENGWLDPDAVARVEGRLRGAGRPPRTRDEMAEWLRRIGDLADDELQGPMAGFLSELASEARAERIELDGVETPGRWVSAEDSPLYERAFAAEPDEDALTTIVRRFLQTRALIGLGELMARYPIEPALATDLIERFVDEGALLRVGPEDAGKPAWADPRNLAEARRLTVALQRRESVAVPPEAFADFLLAYQHVSPTTKLEGSTAVSILLDQFTRYATSAAFWEQELMPRRVTGYRPAWLDLTLVEGDWAWRASAETSGDPLVAFVARSEPAPIWAGSGEAEPEAATVVKVREHLATRGARFLAEIAHETALPPSSVRSVLRGLVRRGLVTNDRFDPLRPGLRNLDEIAPTVRETSTNRHRPGRTLTLPRSGRRLANVPEGRWSLIDAAGASSDSEDERLAWAAVLLGRYGILCRETAALDPWAPPWRELAEVLDRAEWRGEVRRGYFVEGLSGVQYATAEAASTLARHAADLASGTASRAPTLISAADPANVYGSGAPFDIPLLEGGSARLTRSAANHLVLCGGRPVLIMEAHARRLTRLASASDAEVRAALTLVPSLAAPPRRVLKLETVDSRPAWDCPLATALAEVGFVRDYPGMAYYGGT